MAIDFVQFLQTLLRGNSGQVKPGEMLRGLLDTLAHTFFHQNKTSAVAVIYEYVDEFCKSMSDKRDTKYGQFAYDEKASENKRHEMKIMNTDTKFLSFSSYYWCKFWLDGALFTFFVSSYRLHIRASKIQSHKHYS